MKKWYGNAALLSAAVIWGFAFVAQSVGMDYVGPFTFQASRSLLGAVALLPLVWFLDGRKKKRPDYVPPGKAERKRLWQAGLVCGLVLCTASCLQQCGILYTTVGKAGFLTSMYLVLVPVLGIFLRRPAPRKIWLCVAGCAVGIYLLSVTESFTLSAGDSLVILCAFFFAIHIMVIDHFGAEVDGVKLSCIQFLVTAVISGALMFIFEKPSWQQLMPAGISILYAGILSCGAAYTLQIIGQQHTTDPTSATLLLSMESVFSLVGGMLILKQIPSVREFLGCALVFASVIVAQLPVGEAKCDTGEYIVDKTNEKSI